MDEAIKILLTYGPGGVIAVLVVLGVLVPRSFYDREVKRGDNATTTASQNAEALKQVGDALRIVSEQNAGLKSEVSGLKEEMGNMRKDFQNALATRGPINA